jgi:hypothetical protein
VRVVEAGGDLDLSQETLRAERRRVACALSGCSIEAETFTSIA